MQRLLFDGLGGRTGRLHVAATRLRPGQPTEEHTHDYVEWFLVEAGAGTHHWNGLELPLAKGSFAFVRARDCHRYTADARRGLRFVNLAVSGEWWREFERLCLGGRGAERALCGEPAGHAVLPTKDANWCGAVMSELLAGGSDDPALLAEAVAGFMRRLRPPRRVGMPARTLPPAWLTALVAEFGDATKLAQPIAYWQRRSGVSPEHLSRTCRRCYGEPPTVLLNRARVEYVKTRILEGEEKITALAFDAGFQNLGFFYRCFRRFVGCTPRAWGGARGSEAVVPR